MSDKSFDVIVIGAGPGGYVAAIRAAQLGLRTACVEKRETLGGTCLNVGCIPSKAMLQASEKYHEAADGILEKFGVKTGKVSLDLETFHGHTKKVVGDNTKGIEFLFKKNKVSWLKGSASFVGEREIQIGKTRYKAEKGIIIATGSDVASLPDVTIDEKRIVSSTGALSLDKVPEKMVVIGGGYIGLEMGSVWQRLGAEVTVVEYLDRILPGMDEEISKQMLRVLSKQGLKFKLGHKVEEVKSGKNAASLRITPAKGGDTEKLEADIVLVAVGRKAYTEGLSLDKIGVKTNERGLIITDAHWQTNVKGVYAIGDVIAGPMLAHKAEEEGVAVAEILAGQSGHVNYDVIPGVVYTWPEAAQIGKTEEQLKSDGISYKVGKFPYTANGRARAMQATEGFVKILADRKTDRILGVHILGAEAGTLIAEAALAMEFGATAQDVALTCHAHPTLSEIVKEAALAVDGRALHM